MSNELLFEIGTEEIPAGFLSKAVVDMEENVRQCCILLQLSNVGNRLILKIFQDLQIMP